MKDQKRRLNRRAAIMVMMAAMLAIASLIAGCSSGDNNAGNSASQELKSMDSNTAGAYDMPADQEQDSKVYLTANNGEAEAPEAQDEKLKMSATGAVSTSADQAASAIGALDRKLIYNAQVTMEVKDYGAAQTELFNMVALSGGYMVNFSDNQTSYELGGTFAIKVPSTGFQSFLSQLKSLKKGDAYQQNVRGQDVTEEYVDLESRLKAKQVVETRLLAFMDKATASDDLLRYSNELARVQEEIETIKGRMRYIDQNVAYSTIELRMYEKLKASGGGSLKEDRNAIERAGDAMKASAAGVLAFFEGLLVVLAGSLPITVILVLVLVPVWIAYRKTRYKRRSETRHAQLPELEEQGKSEQD